MNNKCRRGLLRFKYEKTNNKRYRKRRKSLFLIYQNVKIINVKNIFTTNNKKRYATGTMVRMDFRPYLVGTRRRRRATLAKAPTTVTMAL